MNTLNNTLYRKEGELLAITNGDCRIFMREMGNEYFITMYNQESGEELIISILSRELNGRHRDLPEEMRKREYTKREHAIQIVAKIFWQYPNGTLWLKLQQLKQLLEYDDIKLLKVEHIGENFKKTKLFPKVENAEIGRKVFETGIENPNMDICILQNVNS